MREEEQQLFVLLRCAAPRRQAALEGADVCISWARSSVTCSGKRGSVALTPLFPSTNEEPSGYGLTLEPEIRIPDSALSHGSYRRGRAVLDAHEDAHLPPRRQGSL